VAVTGVLASITELGGDVQRVGWGQYRSVGDIPLGYPHGYTWAAPSEVAQPTR
jgi:hypothetical protein